MKFAKTTALAALAAALMGSTAFAATAATTTATATPTANAAHATCASQAKEQHLAGAARKSFMKKCRADAPKK